MSKLNINIVQNQIKRHLARSFITVFSLVALTVPSYVSASTFGGGTYGSCPFQADCASTVVTLPSPTPLQVNINLKNGQVIPRSGYTIVVTPLNGQGTSFQQVHFYIDGTLVHTQSPDEQGTVSWFWDVGQDPGTDIKVVVTGQDGQTVSQTFTVTLGATASSNAQPSGLSAVLQQIVAAPQQAVQSITHTIAKLPKTVKYSLPYFLFLLLGGDILLLLYRTRHEIAESKRLQELLARERQNSELKHTFTELISHYLRTPITIINVSLDLATSKQAPASPAVASTRGCTQRLIVAVDDLLKQLSAGGSVVASQQVLQPSATRPFWQQPGLYAPLGLIGFVVFCFDYLAHHSRGFSISQINLIIQIISFGSLSFLVYQVLRQQQLKRQDRAETARVLEAETAFNNERDQIIAYSATNIKQLVDELTVQTVQLQPPEVQRLASRGSEQLKDVVDKLLIANQLKGSRAIQPYAPVRLNELINEALKELKDQLAAKTVHIKVLHNTEFQTQSKELLVIVLSTILDNAIAYSAEGGEVEVDAVLNATTVSISISDRGVGIPSDKRYSLFQAFSKTEGAETFNHEGMGFSLYLDKLIMNYLVGDIAVESEFNQGTRATLTLPQPVRE